jgi:hypothetical protein
MLSIPDNTWILRPYPANDAGIRSGKHIRSTRCPLDGRIYHCGGDYSSPWGPQSGQNTLWSYGVEAGDWRMEYPYCGPVGEMQPCHPDEVGWVWDSKRNRFLCVPGYFGGDVGRCAGKATLYRWLQAWSFETKKWSAVSANNNHPLATSAGSMTFATYDAVADKFYQFAYSSWGGIVTFDCAAGLWSWKSYGMAKNVRGEYAAWDPNNRHMYALHTYSRIFYRFNAASLTVSTMAPFPAAMEPGSTRLHWDNVNKVILFPQRIDANANVKLHAYHPDTNTWEMDIQAAGPAPIGSCGYFDEGNNVLVIWGTTGSATVGTPGIMLYRYKAGAGGGDTTPPQIGPLTLVSQEAT